MLSKRAQALKPSPTLALAARAKELAAQGKDVISLTVGEPDWDTFSPIKQAAIRALDAGKTKYTPASGIPELREAVARQTSEDLGLSYEPGQVTVSVGAKFILYAALQMLCEEGDEVLVPAPYWVSYPEMAHLAGATSIILNTTSATDFKITPEQLDKLITAKSKVVILNSPSNPTGEIYSREELKGLAEVIKKHPQLWVISDDIYNRLIFSEETVAPHILHVAPELKDRVLVVNGASKTYSMTGWRIGWAVGASELIGAMTKLQSQSVSCAPSFVQWATLEALHGVEGELREALSLLKRRRDFICRELNALDEIRVATPAGAFYVWPDISAYLGRAYQGQVIKDSKDFSQVFLDNYMVATVPGVEFGCDGFLRVSYALSEDRVRQAIGRLRDFLHELKV